MAYVRKKGKYHYLVEGYREGGKVKQRVLAYLGEHETVESLLESREIDFQQFMLFQYRPCALFDGDLKEFEREIDKLKSYCSAQKL